MSLLTIKSIINKYSTSDRDFTKIDGKSKWLIDMISELSEFTKMPESKLYEIERYCTGYADYDRKMIRYIKDEFKDNENYEAICEHLGLPIIQK